MPPRLWAASSSFIFEVCRISSKEISILTPVLLSSLSEAFTVPPDLSPFLVDAFPVPPDLSPFLVDAFTVPPDLLPFLFDAFTVSFSCVQVIAMLLCSVQKTLLPVFMAFTNC
ncbi:hypothetical protein CsSME_00018178 [Camellia sinensis var. sinensis]